MLARKFCVVGAGRKVNFLWSYLDSLGITERPAPRDPEVAFIVVPQTVNRYGAIPKTVKLVVLLAFEAENVRIGDGVDEVLVVDSINGDATEERLRVVLGLS